LLWLLRCLHRLPHYPQLPVLCTTSFSPLRALAFKVRIFSSIYTPSPSHLVAVGSLWRHSELGPLRLPLLAAFTLTTTPILLHATTSLLRPLGSQNLLLLTAFTLTVTPILLHATTSLLLSYRFDPYATTFHSTPLHLLLPMPKMTVQKL